MREALVFSVPNLVLGKPQFLVYQNGNQSLRGGTIEFQPIKAKVAEPWRGNWEMAGADSGLVIVLTIVAFLVCPILSKVHLIQLVIQ